MSDSSERRKGDKANKRRNFIRQKSPLAMPFHLNWPFTAMTELPKPEVIIMHESDLDMVHELEKEIALQLAR
jgi:hypothetical protein